MGRHRRETSARLKIEIWYPDTLEPDEIAPDMGIGVQNISMGPEIRTIRGPKRADKRVLSRSRSGRGDICFPGLRYRKSREAATTNRLQGEQ